MTRHGLILTLLIPIGAIVVALPLLCGQNVRSDTSASTTTTSGDGKPRSTGPATEADEEFNGESTSSSDGGIQSSLRASAFSKGRRQSEFSSDEQTWIKDNCKWNMPASRQGASLGPVIIIAREGLVLGHSSLSKIPYWVCEHATAARLNGPGNRKLSKFLPDPKLARFPRALLPDYAHSGYDRGHMAPAADEKTTQKMMDDCHFLSNMVPQIGPTFNRGIWAQLEATVRKWTLARGESWIVTGPLFYDPLEEDETTADGLVPHDAIGDDHVAVPTHCYKILLAKSADGDWQSIAFVLQNKTYAKPFQLSLYLTTIDWIEERAGLDFFPALTDDPSSLELMNRLESTKSAMWEE